jgi:hypothetical protein
VLRGGLPGGRAIETIPGANLTAPGADVARGDTVSTGGLAATSRPVLLDQALDPRIDGDVHRRAVPQVRVTVVVVTSIVAAGAT